MAEQWYAIYDEKTGELVSTGTVVADDKHLKANGLVKKKIAKQPDEDHTSGTMTHLVDIAVGAAASEQVILPNILVSVGSGSALPNDLVYLPMAVKAGQRIAARCQSATASAAMTVGVYLVGQT
jgi:hypothetical protein